MLSGSVDERQLFHHVMWWPADFIVLRVYCGLYFSAGGSMAVWVWFVILGFVVALIVGVIVFRIYWTKQKSKKVWYPSG